MEYQHDDADMSADAIRNANDEHNKGIYFNKICRRSN